MKIINEGREAFNKHFEEYVGRLESILSCNAQQENSKRENANIDGDSAMGTMLHIGSTTSREFSLDYLIPESIAKAHLDGDIHIHDLDFYAAGGTTTCTQIDLEKLFKDGFSTGHGFLRQPKGIMSYAALAAIAIQSNQNDQHGGQSIPYFDRYLAPGVLETFNKEIDKYYRYKTNKAVLPATYASLDIAQQKINADDYAIILKEVEKTTFQAMEGFVHNLNTMHSRAGAQVPFSSINLGMDTTQEGRMVTKQYLLAHEAGLGKGETPIFPIAIFTVKDGVNYKEGDPNYDLFKLAIRVSAKRMFPNFCFIDAPFNLPFYEKDPINGIVATMGCRTRVMANICGPAVTPGRGNLSFTTINLPRLALKSKGNLEQFFYDLDTQLNLVKEQILLRLDYQMTKCKYNFPFLMGQGIWMDADKLGYEDNLKEVLKHGTLSIGFIGLAETLKALTGKHHGESKEAQNLGLEIVGFIRKRCDEYSNEYKLNFTCLATPAEGLSGRFVKQDREMFGSIDGVTDKDYYTNSNHVPVHYQISAKDKITIEAPYHTLTNAGHITYVEMDGDPSQNLEAFESIIRMMKENGIGYGAINHPLDRDPECGYVGVIGDCCPGCGRRENEFPSNATRERLHK